MQEVSAGAGRSSPQPSGCLTQYLYSHIIYLTCNICPCAIWWEFIVLYAAAGTVVILLHPSPIRRWFPQHPREEKTTFASWFQTYLRSLSHLKLSLLRSYNKRRRRPDTSVWARLWYFISSDKNNFPKYPQSPSDCNIYESIHDCCEAISSLVILYA